MHELNFRYLWFHFPTAENPHTTEIRRKPTRFFFRAAVDGACRDRRLLLAGHHRYLVRRHWAVLGFSKFLGICIASIVFEDCQIAKILLW